MVIIKGDIGVMMARPNSLSLKDVFEQLEKEVHKIGLKEKDLLIFIVKADAWKNSDLFKIKPK
jgi:hypothetical protein